jgi:protein involved in polysaccharide export with SLBB domain
MKSGLLIVAFVVVFAGCTGSKRANSTAPQVPGTFPAVVSNNATNDAPATNTYRNAESQDVIKPGDTLLITFTNLRSGPIPTFDQRVREDGTITLIYNNVFHVAGRKTGDLEKEMREFYVPVYFADLTVTVRLACQGSCVYVDGGFRNPGRYAWTNGMTLKDAIDAAGGFAAAGGFTEFATHRIEIIHLDGAIKRFRLRGDWARTNNPALQDGDRIHNPRDLL